MNRNHRMQISGVLAALSLSVTAGSAFAAEITGNGKRLDVNGRSICAFSGLNDEFIEGDLAAARVQSYGQSVRSGDIDPNGAFKPISLCNPHVIDLHND